MVKSYDVGKVVFCFLLSSLSLHIFILDFGIVSISNSGSIFFEFFLALFASLKKFDVIWVILEIFLFNFYYVNFDILVNFKKNRISTILSFIFSVMIIIFISLFMYGNLSMIFDSFFQFYKCFVIFIGYFFILYIYLSKFIFFVFGKCRG